MWEFILNLAFLSQILICKATSNGERYEVPLEKVPRSPLESLYEYPVAGNNFTVNETHVFWPMNRKLFSKFYMNLEYENQTMFGFSQQYFGVQRAISIYPEAGHTMGANDHVAFVKSEGSWRDHHSTQSSDGLDLESDNIEFTPHQQKLLSQRIMYLSRWVSESGIKKIVAEQSKISNQFPLLKNQSYTIDSKNLESKLRDDMKSFSAGITHTDYHNFGKSAIFCLHLNTDGAEPTTEGDEQGWWLPLRHKFLAWRGMNWFEPVQKQMLTTGTLSITSDQDFLNVVFKAGQLFRADAEELDLLNMKLYISPPNEITDTRPMPTAKPIGPLADSLRLFLTKHPSNKYLPWAPREQLCPQESFESRFNDLITSCPNSFPKNASTECIKRYISFYPCFNYLIRSSEKYSHGMDSLLEMGAINHAMSEAPWDAIKALAEEKPWDDEFEDAINILGLHPTTAKEQVMVQVKVQVKVQHREDMNSEEHDGTN